MLMLVKLAEYGFDAKPIKAAFLVLCGQRHRGNSLSIALGKLKLVRGNGSEGLMDVNTFSSNCCSF